MVPEQQSDHEGFPPPHHQVPLAEPLCLMGNVVLMRLKVDQLQVAAAPVGACECTRRKKNKNKTMRDYGWAMKSELTLQRRERWSSGWNTLQKLCDILSLDHNIPPHVKLHSHATNINCCILCIFIYLFYFKVNKGQKILESFEPYDCNVSRKCCD